MMNLQELQALSKALDHGIINMTDVLEQVEDMTRKSILKQHEEFCSVWQGADGRFKTKLPDGKAQGGKKLIAKTSREHLEKCIVDWYKEMRKEQKNPKTMQTLYPAWLSYKAEETTPANATKLQWVWDTYYQDSEIVKMDIADLDVIIMKEWFLKTVRVYHLTSKKYKEMKSLANMLLDFAVEKRMAHVNVARNVRGISRRKFAEPHRKNETEQVYVDDERERLLMQAERQYGKTVWEDRECRLPCRMHEFFLGFEGGRDRSLENVRLHGNFGTGNKAGGQGVLYGRKRQEPPTGIRHLAVPEEPSGKQDAVPVKRREEVL